MKLRVMLNSLWLLILITFRGFSPALASTNESDSPPQERRNVLFITCDQRMFKSLQARGFKQPAIERLADRGVTFESHYIASAVSTPSRGVIYSGRAPQVTGIQDEMMFGWTPSLTTNQVSMGTAMKKLGYETAYFGKFELDTDIVFPKPGVNYSDALKKYGFDLWQPYGDVTGEPDQGYQVDGVVAADGISWLRTNAQSFRKNGKNWFLVISFVNPHDIFFANVNFPGESVQKPLNPALSVSVPANAEFQKQWEFALWHTLDEPLRAPGRPSTHWEFYKGIVDVMGDIPTNRRDMWHAYNNYYLNLLKDNDRRIGEVLDALDNLDLWKDTVVVFTSDHGELCGSHGGLRNKGPLCYEQNVHVPMIVAHPDVKGGQSIRALTSHIDLLPTLVSLTGAPKDAVANVTRGLPGRDFSTVLADPSSARFDAVRPGILFNYVGLSSVDADFFKGLFEKMENGGFAMKPSDLAKDHPDLSKRGFLAMTFDGRYKFGRYYAPNNFNTPKTLEEILAWNDLELFDLKVDPEEKNNLALNPEQNKALILRMNTLLNELMAREVGVNDGKFLPAPVRPKGNVSRETSTESPK
ncbi:sulfatase-like hydrolase/transferase [Candidatus Omnitrophota bacterium]